MPGTPKQWLTGIAVVTALTAAYLFFGRSAAPVQDVPVFTAQRGQLQINVLQGGEIRALRNVEIKSEIETPTTILNLIPEGYFVTEEDIKDGKVLVELDNSDIKQRMELSRKSHEKKQTDSEAKYSLKASVGDGTGKVKLKMKGGAVVDPDSGLDSVAHVLLEQHSNEPYSCVLGLVDIVRGSNSYYKIQILEHNTSTSTYT